jgi:hypothetical protein
MTGNWLPPLLKLEDHAEDPSELLAAAHARYVRDFITSRPTFRGLPVGCQKTPMEKGKQAGFWHIVSAGPEEDERTADLRRYERIEWPRAIIEAAEKGVGSVKVWSSRRGRSNRIVIALADFSYKVVLKKCKDFYLLRTAYPVEKQHMRRKAAKEYEKQSATRKTRRRPVKDGVVTPSTRGG